MDHVDVRWVRQPPGVPLVLVTLAVGTLWAAARCGPAPAGQVEEWAGLPAGVRPRAASRARPLRAAEQVQRPRRPRPATVLTWEQERELARSDLHALCGRARRLAGSAGDGDTLLDRAWSPAARGMKLQQALASAAQQETQLQEKLRRARGPSDVFAIQQETGRIRSVLNRAQTWFQKHRTLAGSVVRRQGRSRDTVAGRVRDLPPAPGRKGAGHRR